MAPLKADPAAASVDLYYELPSTGGLTLRPGERVMVEVPLKGTEQGLVVPEASVLYDIHGDTWVYEDLGGNAYARRRVQIARHAGDRAVIARGHHRGHQGGDGRCRGAIRDGIRSRTLMRWLVALSLRNRIVVVALAVLLVVGAVRTLRTTPLDVFPEFAPPLVEVQTEAPGLSTNDVEALVTVPLEAALNGVPGLDRIRSKSVLGLSSVVLILDPATDVMTLTADGAGAPVAGCCLRCRRSRARR